MRRSPRLCSLLFLLLAGCKESDNSTDAVKEPGAMGGAGNANAGTSDDETTVNGDSTTATNELDPSGPSEPVETSDAPGEAEPVSADDSDTPNASPDSETSNPDSADAESTPEGSSDPAEGENDTEGSSHGAESSSDGTEPGTDSDGASASGNDGDTLAAAPDAGDAGGKISCDPRSLLCRRAAPACDEGQVPRVVDGCYAECVQIDECACTEPAACPDQDRFTCRNDTQNCSYYLR